MSGSRRCVGVQSVISHPPSVGKWDGRVSPVYLGDAGGYVLPLVDGARLVDFSDASVDERTVESLRYRRDYSLLVVGGTGSGKTTTLKVFAFQQRVNPDEPRVVFDYKEDWKKFYMEGS